MTVKELIELLSGFDEDMEVELGSIIQSGSLTNVEEYDEMVVIS